VTYTRIDFARAFLDAIEASHHKRNLWALVAWMQAEGSAAKFNPLATTQDMPGATDFNWDGVKDYTSFEQGVAATAKTLNYGADRGLYGYKPIRRRLRKSVLAYWTLRAVESSQWGTGGLALRCLRTVKRDWQVYAFRPIGQ
jgi:hypothetical protein